MKQFLTMKLFLALAVLLFVATMVYVLGGSPLGHLFDNSLALGMLGYSIIPKPAVSRRNVANANGAVLTNGGQIRIPLNKDFLAVMHRLNVSVSQTWGTNAPSSSDVRRFFSRIELVSNEGSHYSSDFHQFYDAMRYTERASAPVVALGAGGGAAATAKFSVNMHHAMHATLADLVTALQTSGFSTLDLVLTISPDASNGFIGGTGVVGAAAYTVGVDSIELPDMSGQTKEQRDGIVFGKARHYLKSMKEVASASAAVSNEEVVLKTGGKTRFIFLHSYNTTGAIPTLANGIIDKITLDFGGRTYFGSIEATSIQQENVAVRDFNQTGVYVIDMGKNPKGWLDMENVNEIKLLYSTLSTKPAGWKVTVAQDWVERLSAAGIK